MKAIEDPASLARELAAMFPSFAHEMDNEELDTYHHVVGLLTPHLSDYLQHADERTIEQFCNLVNVLAEAGGEKENAISTCLLEHASQVRITKLIRPHLRSAARRELR